MRSMMARWHALKRDPKTRRQTKSYGLWLEEQAEAMQARIGALEEREARLKSWCEAYPLDIFPEPDFKRVAAVLKENGLTLGAVAASNMRHVLKGVEEILAGRK